MPNVVMGHCLSGKTERKNRWLSQKLQELFHTRGDRTLDINLCIKVVKTFIFTGIQRVKTRLFYKSNRQCEITNKLFMVWCRMETSTVLRKGQLVAINPTAIFGLLACSKYLGAPNINWKYCLLFGQHSFDCIPYKSTHKSHILHMLIFC